MRCTICTRVSTNNQGEKEFFSFEAPEEKISALITSQNNWLLFKVGYTEVNFNHLALQGGYKTRKNHSFGL